ncbi:DUF3892 domain-containing protein [Proteus mirabilis]|uniref:DUF3892 domain-containing protein n=1 Tax=Proteus mirabilis TaxID=584 RepID=UPI0018C4C356|nr:DUF3892 domain-containing protein [Proteus mirabilis]MBG6018605.1 DUF3892 domain-containing protein [Proteus mirabilis]WFC30032.1 DUF3892 domain-containing protein [Proteus mirabilis]HDT3001171.1 DUF3892 domain-containing protein [Proteus mirabilis]
MADFYISAIRMDSKGQHIEWVKTHKNIDNKSLDSKGSINSRKFVGELISSGKITFKTVIWNQSTKKWDIGAIVEVMASGYITTDPNRTKLDNLGNLPLF